MIPVAVAIRTLTAAGARVAARKLEKNIGTRVGRLMAKEIDTKAISEFQTLVANKPGPSATRNELVSYVSKLHKVDQNPGTRAATAGATYRAEKAAQRRSALLSKASHPITARELSTAELREIYRLKMSQLAGQARYVESEFGPTHATRKFKEFREARKGRPVDSLNRNELLHATNRMTQIGNYEGITARGARQQQARGIELLGPKYGLLTPEEQSAVWDEVNNLKARAGEQIVDSVSALGEMRIALNNDKDFLAEVKFYRSPSGHLKAMLAQDKDRMAIENTRYLAHQQMIEKRTERAKERAKRREEMRIKLGHISRPKF